MINPNFQIVMFLIIFMTMNGQTYKSFENILQGQRGDKFGLATLNLYFDTIYQLKGQHSKFLLLNPLLSFTSKNV